MNSIGDEITIKYVFVSFRVNINIKRRKEQKMENQISAIFRISIEQCRFVSKQVVVNLTEMWSEQQQKEESCLLFSTSVFPQNGRTMDFDSYSSKNKGQKLHSLGSYNSSTQSKSDLSGRNESFILL